MEMKKGVMSIRIMFTASAMSSMHLLKAWKVLRNGRPLVNLYGTTEVGMIACTGWNDATVDVNVSLGRL